jgi:predicted GNAT family acetyltransferase
MAAMPNVRDNTALSRFELDADGATAFVNYKIDGGRIALLHTETPVALRGRGIASRLVHDVLEDIRARGLKMVPRCAFVHAYLAKHPEFHDLVA